MTTVSSGRPLGWCLAQSGTDEISSGGRFGSAPEKKTWPVMTPAWATTPEVGSVAELFVEVVSFFVRRSHPHSAESKISAAPRFNGKRNDGRFTTLHPIDHHRGKEEGEINNRCQEELPRLHPASLERAEQA